MMISFKDGEILYKAVSVVKGINSDNETKEKDEETKDKDEETEEKDEDKKDKDEDTKEKGEESKDKDDTPIILDVKAIISYDDVPKNEIVDYEMIVTPLDPAMLDFFKSW
mmetsp:Transcript_10849/g.9297  ORF Transcript_10849/g.9297 Transcript_10849/m.9297 type:complete len:110 (-) Transcript_10849:1047-1376(-)